MDPTRREILLGSIALTAPLMSDDIIPIFDMHCHPPFPTHNEAWVLKHQRGLGIRTSTLLPMNSAAAHTSILPSFTIARGSAIGMAKKYPTEFLAFTIADPRKSAGPGSLRRDLGAGASGVGEMEFPIACDSSKMEVVYELAQEYRTPVLLHFEHGASNWGFERFHRIAAKYPRVTFIGHAQTWWGNIDLHHRQEQIWPEPNWPVTPGGITDRLLSDYPNVFGDLSASSGLNALIRDTDHARAFLSRHQDKLLFGTDCLHHGIGGPQCWGARTLVAVHELAPSKEILRKILWTNARQLLLLSETL